MYLYPCFNVFLKSLDVKCETDAYNCTQTCDRETCDCEPLGSIS